MQERVKYIFMKTSKYTLLSLSLVVVVVVASREGSSSGTKVELN